MVSFIEEAHIQRSTVWITPFIQGMDIYNTKIVLDHCGMLKRHGRQVSYPRNDFRYITMVLFRLALQFKDPTHQTCEFYGVILIV